MPLSPHNTELYELGRGILEIAEFSGGAPGAYTDVGNCPRFEFEVTEEVIEHKESRGGLRSKDKEATLEAGYMVSFDLDEIAASNMEMYIRGEVDGSDPYTFHALTTAGTQREYALRFTQDNQEGPNKTFNFWRCKLKPGGAHSVIGDDWNMLPFSGAGLADDTNHPDGPYFSVKYHSTTTTTSSTTTTTTTA